MREAIKIKHEPSPRGWNEPETNLGTEVVILVACLAALALTVAAVTGRLDIIGAKLFGALGI